MELTPVVTPHKLKLRKITRADVEEIARLIITRRLNETDSCNLLNINPRRWFKWKDRAKHKGEFDSLLSRVRAANIDAVIQTIDEAGTPCEGKRSDWRAKAWIAERVLAPELFGQQQAGNVTNQTAIIIGAGGETSVLKMLDAIYQAKLPPSEPLKQLESEQVLDCTNDKPACQRAKLTQ